MNKETFLGELREYLKILEDQERDDILAEYAQHIDMKMQKGLSEEEAIKDFGSIQELAAEILEAYHVKPEVKPEVKRISNLKEKLLQGFRAIGQGFRRFWERCLAFGRWLAKPFKRKGGQRKDKTLQTQGEGETDKIQDKQMKMGAAKKMGSCMASFFRTLGQGIVILWRVFLEFCIWWIRLLWNMGWLVFSLFCSCLCMFALMGFGALLILLFQGYPLLGILLICLGGILSMGALTCGAFTLIVRKKTNVALGNGTTGDGMPGKKVAGCEAAENEISGRGTIECEAAGR